MKFELIETKLYVINDSLSAPISADIDNRVNQDIFNRFTYPNGGTVFNEKLEDIHDYTLPSYIAVDSPTAKVSTGIFLLKFLWRPILEEEKGDFIYRDYRLNAYYVDASTMRHYRCISSKGVQLFTATTYTDKAEKARLVFKIEKALVNVNFSGIVANPEETHEILRDIW